MSTDLRLSRQLSTGPDGVRYEGSDGAGRALVVERLFLARRHPARWAELTSRLAVAARLHHPAVVAPLAAVLDGDDPYLVKPLLGTLREASAFTLERAVALVTALADAVAAAHRMGLPLGTLCPATIVFHDGKPAIDVTGTRTGSTLDFDDFDRVCTPPERGAPTFPGDVFALGALATSILRGRATQSVAEAEALAGESATRKLGRLLAEMLDPDGGSRPAMAEVVARLGRAETTEILGAPESLPPMTSRNRIGRYELLDLLGEGGMGRVYRARDIGSEDFVALKVLHDRLIDNDQALKRFYREARVLADLDNEFIARFIEVNQDGAHHFLAMELVEGASLSALLDHHGRFPIPFALAVVRDVARALADVHDLGVVHRDIKPGNVLLVGASPTSPVEDPSAYPVKLCDFGIATSREGDEELTRAGMALGTPHYMAPEQCVGAEVGPASDVYALGITLYKLLAGVVPFNAPDARAIVYAHLRDPIPDIRTHDPVIPDEVVALLEGMLQKAPDERIPHARALLEIIEETARGAPRSITAHPRRPHDDNVARYVFQWQLRASPERLWPHVSHTERINRAIGLGAVEYSRRAEDDRIHNHGRFRHAGMLIEWREHPYEWVAPRRMGILREYSSGPFEWLRSTVELEARSGGTLLTHTIELEPRGMLGRAAAAMEVGYKTKKALERVYHRIDGHLSREAAEATRLDDEDSLSDLDPFEPPPPLSSEQLGRIDAAVGRMLDHHLDRQVVERLAIFLRGASAQEVGRIRPRAFARRFDLDYREVLRVCLHGVKEGLLEMLWDVICPRCQIPADIAGSLAKLREQHRCEACDVDFAVDFGGSVEIIFRAHPQMRQSELGTYCIGGPGHTPHVVAQVLLARGERFELELSLEEGSYQVASRELPVVWGFSVRHGAQLSSWEIPLREGAAPGSARTLAMGTQRLVLANDLDREVVVRVERRSGREDAITAAEAACTALFRQLFPGEILAPGRLVALQHLSLLSAVLVDAWRGGSDESEVFGRLGALHREIEAAVAEQGGAVVKIHGDGVLAAFHEPVAALRTAASHPRGEGVAMVLHAGSAMATSINDRLDYFGRVVRELDRFTLTAESGNVIISEAVATDPGIQAFLESESPSRQIVVLGGLVAHRLTFP